MSGIAIRCHPSAPVSIPEIDRWLDDLVAELRLHRPAFGVRLTHLTRRAPGGDLRDGWLIELEPPPETRLEDAPELLDALRDALRDLRLLGLAPTLLREGRLTEARPADDLLVSTSVV